MSDGGRNKKPAYGRVAITAVLVLVLGYFIFVACKL